MNHRPERVSSLIREKLSELIERELEFPDMLATLTEVEVAKDLENAKVGVTVFPSEKAAEAMRILEGGRPELQHRLNRLLNIKPMPRIHFFVDHGPENAARVEKALLDEIEKEGRGR